MKNGIWIPDEIWLLDWPPMHRIFLAKVLSLSKGRRCTAGDERLAEYLTCSPQNVRKMIKELREAGCIVVSGYGHTRSLAIGTLQGRPRSNQSSKQPQLQELQPEAQVKATTVATRSNHSCGDYRETIELTIEGTKERVALFFPHESDLFSQAWVKWREYRKKRRLKFNTPEEEQIALQKLNNDTNGDEQQAIEAIATAIASGWTGIFPANAKSAKAKQRTASWARDVAERLAERQQGE